MKREFFKRVGMPIAVAVLGIGGAFVSTSMSSGSKTVAQKMGHRIVAGQSPCELTQQTCQTENNGTLCRVDYTNPSSPQLWGKITPSASNCPEVLYRVF